MVVIYDYRELQTKLSSVQLSHATKKGLFNDTSIKDTGYVIDKKILNNMDVLLYTWVNSIF